MTQTITTNTSKLIPLGFCRVVADIVRRILTTEQGSTEHKPIENRTSHEN